MHRRGSTAGSVVWVVCLLVGLVAGGQAQGQPVPGEPAEPIPGKPGPGGEVQFEVPIAGTAGVLIGEIRDCATGNRLAPEQVTAEFVFAEDTTPPYSADDLVAVILHAEDYAPRWVTEFTTLRVDLFIFQLVYVVPAEATICLVPTKKEPCQHCTFSYEVGPKSRSTGGKTEVFVRVRHCDNGSWNPILATYLEALPRPPEGKCEHCTYRLCRQTLTFTSMDGKRTFPVTWDRLYHCPESGEFPKDPVWSNIPIYADQLPAGSCTPGAMVIVQTSRTEGGKEKITETLYQCSNKGVWEKKGFREFDK